MLPAKNIIEVISCLDEIIDISLAKKSRAGYFACLYRKMTIAVQNGINNGLFFDGPRMEQLDVIFANRYINAYFSHTKNTPLTASWKSAFTATGQPYTVIQHLLMGINAHINLDLGIAAAETARGIDIQLIKKDFDLINNIIGSLINIVQKDLEEICAPMKLLKYVDNNSKESVINFSITAARNTAWANALALSTVLPNMYDGYIVNLDKKINVVARNIINPNFSQSMILRAVRAFEPKDVGVIIKFLRD